MMRAISPRREEGACEARNVSGKEIAPESPWNHRFRVGDVVQTVGGGGSYDRGEIVVVAEEENYYRVNYGLSFQSLISGRRTSSLSTRRIPCPKRRGVSFPRSSHSCKPAGNHAMER